MAEVVIKGIPTLLVSSQPGIDNIGQGRTSEDRAADIAAIRDHVKAFPGRVIIGADLNDGITEFTVRTLYEGSWPPFTHADPERPTLTPTMPIPSFVVRSDDPNAYCNRSGIDFIFFREPPADLTFGVSSQSRAPFRPLTYDERCSVPPNSDHPLVLARLR